MSNNGLSDEEKALFRAVNATVKPLKNKKKVALDKKVAVSLEPPPVAKPVAPTITLKNIDTLRDAKKIAPAPTLYLSSFYPEEVGSQSILSFCRYKIPAKRLREFKNGQIPWSAKLDLHGLKPDEARDACVSFTFQEIAKHHRCFLIIHGKGSLHGEAPILKNLVNHWLRQIPEILAFHSALPRDGGAGALYVLLKRQRET